MSLEACSRTGVGRDAGPAPKLIIFSRDGILIADSGRIDRIGAVSDGIDLTSRGKGINDGSSNGESIDIFDNQA